jgi:hypothetical protein
MKVTKDNIEYITKEAHAFHMEILQRYDNRPQDQQRHTLKALVHMFSEMAAGVTIGRYPWPISTGAGKTTAIVAWIVTLERLKVEGVSLAIAASMVEALCRLKRELVAYGVPTDRIGLLHAKQYNASKPDEWRSNDEYASKPATDENHRRPYMLVTQQRVKSADTLDEYFFFNGERRAFCVWDESLFSTDYWTTTGDSFQGATATLVGLKEDHPELVEMADGFQLYQRRIKAELARSVETGKTRPFDPPKIPLTKLIEWEALEKDNRKLLHQGTKCSLPFFNQTMRAYPWKTSGGLVYHQPSIPAEHQMPSMVILDASFPIRELEQADTTLKEVQGVSFSFKRYDNLTIHQWCHASGRDSMRKDFHGDSKPQPVTMKSLRSEWLAQAMAEQKVAKKVAQTAAMEVPLNEAMLFFVFKPEQSSQATYRSVLEQQLIKQGIDLQGTINVTEYDASGQPVQVQKPRVVVLTFGQETGINDYSYVQNVFLVGMLHREESDVVGQYVAQCNGSEKEQHDTRTAHRLVQSEIVHTIYQALSRGRCRVTVDGQGLPMRAWIIYKEKTIRPSLEVVMHGVQWKNWSSGKAEDPRATQLREHLETIPPESFPVLIPEVKQATKLNTVSRQVWRTLTEQAFEGTPFNINKMRIEIQAGCYLLLGEK